VGIWEWLQGNPKKKYRERFPKQEKPSNPPPEESEEPAPESDEVGESNPEALDEKAEEKSQETSAEESEEPAPESDEVGESAPEDKKSEISSQETSTEETEEPVSGAPTKESVEQISESIIDDSNKPISQSSTEELKPPLPPKVEEAGELSPEQPDEKTEKPVSAPNKFRVIASSIKLRLGRKTKDKEKTAEPEFLKFLILPITLVSMLIGLSIMPLFPQPLPAILAFLIAFLTYKKPILGMPIGGLVIGLGLMYNLAKMDFISMLGEPDVRSMVVYVFLFLFTALPIIFRSRKAVISINLGIIAAISLFFNQTYYLAIPIIFTAIVLFKKTSILTAIYYLLLSVPLQVMQYLNLIMPIEQWDWWILPGTSPPVFVPLTEVFEGVQESMLQFRLYDTSILVNSISDQITSNPPVLPHTVLEMLSHYIDSFPGIIMFLFMVIGVVLAFIFLMRMFFKQSNISHAERLFPTLTATVGVAIFFILASSLQDPLAFRVDVNAAQMTVATFAAFLFTLPTLLMDYTPKERASVDMIMEKARKLEEKLKIAEEEVAEVKKNLPISIGPFEVKLAMISDRLNEILSKTKLRLDEASEIDKIFSDLDSLSCDLDNLMSELDIAVGEYQVFVNCEYSKWLGMFKDIGLEPMNTATIDFQQTTSLRMRIEQINAITETGITLTNEVIEVAEQTYEVIRSFYDPNLPEENQSISFAKKKLAEEAAPWIALDALFNAIINWSKHYKAQISKSVNHLKNSLAAIINLRVNNGRLMLVLGEAFPRMKENVEKAENLKIGIEKKVLKAINVIAIKDIFYPSLSTARDSLSILYEKLKSQEKAIQLLSPSEDFLWEKNDALIKRMDSAMQMISKSSNVKLSEVLEKLPIFLSYVDECVETIAAYRDMEELLLNYPVAKKTVENLFEEKKSISPKDLPFEPKYAEEYIKLFYSQKFREFSLDRTNMLLTKKT
jgi:chemotaxis protein histidine kinase CheA